MSLTPLVPQGRAATALKGCCIPGNSAPHSCPHTLALFNTGLHSLNSKLNPPSGLLGMTDMVNIVESVCQDPGRPALAEQETHSQNIVLRWKMRPGNTGNGNLGILLISVTRLQIDSSMAVWSLEAQTDTFQHATAISRKITRNTLQA